MKVTDRSGNVLVDNTAGVEGKQVITDSVAYAVTQVLEGVIYNASYGTANAAALLRAKSLPAKRARPTIGTICGSSVTPRNFPALYGRVRVTTAFSLKRIRGAKRFGATS